MKKKHKVSIIMLMILVIMVGCGQEKQSGMDVSQDDVANSSSSETSGSIAEDEEKDAQSQGGEAEDSKDSQDDQDNQEESNTVTFIDGIGTERVITKNPKRVVIDYNSILGLWYAMGGTSLTKAKGTANVPQEATDLIELGSHAEISLEAILALEPDLVILAANVPDQVALDGILQESGIETMVVDVVTHSYEQVLSNARIFASINEREDLYASIIIPMQQKIDELIEETSAIEQQPKVAALFASSKSMYVESDSAVTGEMIARLGAINILDESEVPIEGEARIPFSIETIATSNPDIILISTMGSEEGARAYVESIIDENPIWSTIQAVKNNAVYYLPKEYSIYKPNEAYDEAFHYIANLLYPDESFR